MNTTSRPRAGALAGFLLLMALILMTVAQTAAAMRDGPTLPSGSVASVSQTQVQQTPLQFRLATAVQHERDVYIVSTAGDNGTVTAVEPSSGVSSTTVWIVAGALIGAALIGLWALAYRRRRQHEATPDCEGSVLGC